MIRFAEPADMPRLIEMGMQFLSSTPRYAGKIEGNPVFLERYFTQLMMAGEHVVFLVLGEPGDAHGMISAIHSTHPHSGASTVAELFWWVDKNRRGRGLSLYFTMMAWARDYAGAEMVQMTASSKKVARIYKKLGFAPLEQVFIKRI